MLNNNQQSGRTPQVCWVLMHVGLHFYLRKGNCGPHGDQCVHMHMHMHKAVSLCLLSPDLMNQMADGN
jgi:hypothetical protein